MIRSIRARLIIYLSLIGLSCGAVSYILFGRAITENSIVWISLFICIILFAGYKIFHCFHLYLNKITFLLDAVENNDYSFRFAEDQGSKRERFTHQTLNRVKEILLQTKMEVATQEKYYELILNKSKTGFIIFDSNGFIRQSNQAALDLLASNVLTHISQFERIDSNLHLFIRELQNNDNKPFTLHTAKGTRTLAFRLSCFSKGTSELCMLTLNDISNELEEKELESWIRLTRVLTHEIMNSIAPIRSVSEFLMNEKEINKYELDKGLDIIHSTSGNLMNFVEHYRRFARIPPAKKELVDVEDLLMQCRRLMIREVDPHVKIYIDADNVNVPLLADRGQIVQAIINLLRNASDAVKTKPSGRIRLLATFHKNSNQWVISIENNGEPISKEMQEQIFVPFFTTKEGGSGIGLSISKQIMRNHHGNLQLTYSNQEATLFSLLF
ncbi:MAG: sensor histidine kinase [Bacteroidales bacterium]